MLMLHEASWGYEAFLLPPGLALLHVPHFFLSLWGSGWGSSFLGNTDGQHRKCSLDWSSPYTGLAKSFCPKAKNILPLSLIHAMNMHTHTYTQQIHPAYPPCASYSLLPNHHQITANDRKSRDAWLLFFTLIKLSKFPPNLRDSTKQIYGNFGSANCLRKRDKYCYYCVGCVCHHDQHLLRPKADVPLCDVSLGIWRINHVAWFWFYWPLRKDVQNTFCWDLTT